MGVPPLSPAVAGLVGIQRPASIDFVCQPHACAEHRRVASRQDPKNLPRPLVRNEKGTMKGLPVFECVLYLY